MLLSTLRGITPRTLHRLCWQEERASDAVAAIRAGRAGSDGDRAAPRRRGRRRGHGGRGCRRSAFPHARRRGVSVVVPAARRPTGRVVRARGAPRRRRGPRGDRRRAAMLDARRRDRPRSRAAAGERRRLRGERRGLRHRRVVASRRARRGRSHDRGAGLGHRRRVSTLERRPHRTDRADGIGRERVRAGCARRTASLPGAEPHRRRAVVRARRGRGSGAQRLAHLGRSRARSRTRGVRGARTGHQPARRGAAGAHPRREPR